MGWRLSAIGGAAIAWTRAAPAHGLAHVDVSILSPLNLQHVGWPPPPLLVEVAITLVLTTPPERRRGWTSWSDWRNESSTPDSVHASHGTLISGAIPSRRPVELIQAIACVDAIRLHQVVHTTCSEDFSLSNAATTARIAMVLPPLAPGEYILLGRVRIPPRHVDDVIVQYDLRRVVVHTSCLAKAEIRSPRNGQAVDRYFTVVPKIILSKAHPVDFPVDTKVCLQVDGEFHSCISAGTFRVRVPTAKTARLFLSVQSSSTPPLSICHDLIEVHTTDPAIVPQSWPRLLHRFDIVAVAPSTHTLVLSPSVAVAYASPSTLSCPLVYAHVPEQELLSVAIVDSWNGKIDWNRYISTEWGEFLSHAVDSPLSYTRVSIAQLVAAIARQDTVLDVIVHFEAPTPSDWIALQRSLATHRHQRPRQFLFCDDLHNCRLHRRDADVFVRPFFHSLDGFIGTYAYAMKAFFEPSYWQHLRTIAWLPHAANSAFQYDNIHPAPVTRVLLVGAANAEFYPLRAWAQKQVGKLPLDVHPHPGYEGYASDTEALAQTTSYARLVHSYVATFTCTSRLDFVVAKIFEIPATGSLLLINHDVADLMARLGFADGTHYIGYDPHDPSAAILYVVNPLYRRRIDRIRRAGQRLVRERHTTWHRVNELTSLLRPNTTPAWAMDDLESRTPCRVEYAGENSSTCLRFHASVLASSCCAVDSVWHHSLHQHDVPMPIRERDRVAGQVAMPLQWRDNSHV